MGWDDVINQQRVKRMLERALETGRVPHASLFSGPEGVGKYAMALELAKTLNCEHSKVSACGACPSCVRAASLQHPDIHLIFTLPLGKNEKYGDGPLEKLSEDDLSAVREQVALKAKNPYHRLTIPRATTIKVNSIRDVRRESSLSAFGGGMKVFILLDADGMNDEASNALLKTLEEPNEHVVIILTSSRPERLLPTIVSRCQQFRFDLLAEESIRDALVNRSGVDAARAAEAAQLSGGSFVRALECVSEETYGKSDEAVELLRTLLVKPRSSLIGEIERIASELDRPAIAELLTLMQSWLRTAMRLNEGISSPAGGASLDALEKFVAHYPRLDFPAALGSIDRAISLLQKNAYIPLVLLDLTIRLKALTGQTTAPGPEDGGKSRARS